MNDRDPFFLLTLAALETPPRAFPPPVHTADLPADLVGDDDDELLEHLREALRRRGYEVS